MSLHKAFESYLLLEKGLSAASVAAYLQDLQKLQTYIDTEEGKNLSLTQLTQEDLQQLLQQLNGLGLSVHSQARILSGWKAFFDFLLLEELIEENPTTLLSMPKLPRNLPSVLSHQEIESMIEQIDHSTTEGLRNRAVVEVLYACGLRVSELINLKLSNLYFEVGFVRVIGKGNKERIVPIGETAMRHLKIYLQERAQMTNVKKESEDIIFLNRRGGQISRNMIFMIIRDLAKAAGIKKKVSPHTFRHSFATHLIEGGANLKVVQDLLGHQSIITTEIYTHLDMNYLREMIQFHPRHLNK